MYTILGADYCPWCNKARQILDYKKIPYKYLDINREIYYKEFLIPGVMEHKTIPKVIYKKKFIGGFTELLQHLKNNKVVNKKKGKKKRTLKKKKSKRSKRSKK